MPSIYSLLLLKTFFFSSLSPYEGSFGEVAIKEYCPHSTDTKRIPGDSSIRC
jgi:hypothetical protein